MSFNLNKCKVMYISDNNTNSEYQMRDSKVGNVKTKERPQVINQSLIVI